LVVAAGALALAACSVPGSQRPPRQPGIWETNVTIGDVVQTTRICIDSNVDQKVDWIGAQATRDNCKDNKVDLQPDGSYRFSSVCDMGARGKVMTSGVAKGDWTVRYTAAARTVTSGAEIPLMDGVREVRVVSSWQGECPLEWRPGDMSVPSGIQYNAVALGATGAAPPTAELRR
jgi:hypothetical protein